MSQITMRKLFVELSFIHVPKAKYRCRLFNIEALAGKNYI